MAVTCPEREKHMEAIQNLTKSVINKASEDAGENDFMNNLAAYLVSGISKFFIEQKLYVEDHYIYSIGKIELQGKPEIVSIGIFGRVFTIDEETAYQKISNELE